MTSLVESAIAVPLGQFDHSCSLWSAPFFFHCGKTFEAYVVVQFYPWFKFYFPLFWGMTMYGNEFETKEIKI